MRRTHRTLAALALGLALVGATTAVAAAATPPIGTQDQASNEKLAEHGLAAQHKTLSQSAPEQTLARHRALGAIAVQPAARTDPAASSPDVDVPVTLLVGLVGGLVGGAAVMVGWTAMTYRRRHLSRPRQLTAGPFAGPGSDGHPGHRFPGSWRSFSRILRFECLPATCMTCA